MIATMPKPTVTELRPVDLAGNAEVRRICGGVSRHTLIAWRKSNGFPKPIRTLVCGEIWDSRAVRDWWQRRNAP